VVEILQLYEYREKETTSINWCQTL